MPGGDGLRRLAERAERMERDWPRDAAQLVEKAVDAGLRQATGDGGFSHGPRMGRASVRVNASSGRARVEAAGSMAVWTILETGTTPHTVDAGPGRVVRTPFGPRRRVRVSGVSGRHTWTRAVTQAMPQVRRDAADEFRRMVG